MKLKAKLTKIKFKKIKLKVNINLTCLCQLSRFVRYNILHLKFNVVFSWLSSLSYRIVRLIP